MMENLEIQFLPESGISLIDVELDVEALSHETAIWYHDLVVNRLAQLNPYVNEHKQEAMQTSYKCEEYDINFDVFDLLPGAIFELHEYYPNKTEKQMIKDLENEYCFEQGVDEFIGY